MNPLANYAYDCTPGQSGPTALGPETTRQFRGTQITEYNREFLPRSRSLDAGLQEDWQTLSGRCRWLGRNEGFQRRLIAGWVKKVIGLGVQIKARAINPAGELLTEFNQVHDRLFAQWSADRLQCDADGRRTWPQMQRVALREAALGGVCFMVRVVRGKVGELLPNGAQRVLPLSYQLLSADRLSTLADRPMSATQNGIFRGVEVDRITNHIVAYYFDRGDPDKLPGASTQPIRLPAERVLAYWEPEEAEQLLGVPWLAADVQPARDQDFLLGSELTTAAIQSLLTVGVFADGATPGTGLVGRDANTDPYGNPTFNLGRATAVTLPKDAKVELFESKHPSVQFAEFWRVLLKHRAMSAGASYASASGDYEQSNYSGGKLSAIDDYEAHRVKQADFTAAIALPVYQQFTDLAVALGVNSEVSPAKYKQDRYLYLQHKLHLPGLPVLDDREQTQTMLSRIAAGLSSWTHELARYGLDFEEIAPQLAQDWETLRALGIEPLFGSQFGSTEKPTGQDSGRTGQGGAP